MSNGKLFHKSFRVEGFLIVPPHGIIKNPEISVGPKEVKINPGCGKDFTHRGVVIPSPCNCHCHLDITEKIEGKDLIDWIKNLILKGLRERSFGPKSEKLLKSMLNLGIDLVCDITKDLNYPDHSHLLPFFEFTGETNNLQELPTRFMVSPHAVYSVSEKLLELLLEKYSQRLMCMHVSESEEEIKFIRGMANRFEDDIYPLVGRKRSVGVYESPIVYLALKGALKKNFLLVHCCYISERDVKIIAEYGATVCVCPRSNLRLSGKTAPVKRLLTEGVNVVLGTDSLGSCPNLNLWEDVELIMEIEKLTPSVALSLVTSNPVKYLKHNRYLLIEANKLPHKTEELSEFVIETLKNREGKLCWISPNP